jgi:hypothetical protein
MTAQSARPARTSGNADSRESNRGSAGICELQTQRWSWQPRAYEIRHHHSIPNRRLDRDQTFEGGQLLNYLELAGRATAFLGLDGAKITGATLYHCAAVAAPPRLIERGGSLT